MPIGLEVNLVGVAVANVTCLLQSADLYLI